MLHASMLVQAQKAPGRKPRKGSSLLLPEWRTRLLGAGGGASFFSIRLNLLAPGACPTLLAQLTATKAYGDGGAELEAGGLARCCPA